MRQADGVGAVVGHDHTHQRNPPTIAAMLPNMTASIGIAINGEGIFFPMACIAAAVKNITTAPVTAIFSPSIRMSLASVLLATRQAAGEWCRCGRDSCRAFQFLHFRAFVTVWRVFSISIAHVLEALLVHL